MVETDPKTEVPAEAAAATETQAAAAAPADAKAGVLDEVTGEMVSKNELKKRQKARKKE